MTIEIVDFPHEKLWFSIAKLSVYHRYPMFFFGSQVWDNLMRVSHGFTIWNPNIPPNQWNLSRAGNRMMVRSIPDSSLPYWLHSWLSKRLLSLQNLPMSKCRTPCQGGSGVVESGTSRHEENAPGRWQLFHRTHLDPSRWQTLSRCQPYWPCFQVPGPMLRTGM